MSDPHGPAEDSTRKSTRRSPKGEERRRQILDAAREIYAQNGYQTASLADIAAAAGISQAGLLHHFPSKQHLLFAVLDRRDAENARITRMDTGEGVDYVNGYLQSLRRSDGNPIFYKLSAIVSAESMSDLHPAHEYFVDHYANRIKNIQRAVEKEFDFTTFPEGVTAEVVTRWIIALSDGLRYQMAYSDEFTDRAGVLTLLLETLRPHLRQESSFSADPPPADSKA